LALFHQSPAAKHHGVRGPIRKELLGREGESRLGPFAAERHLAAQLMKHCREGESEGIAQGM
jgi:hypothetical protein